MTVPAHGMIVVIGASAGGVEALSVVTRALPRAPPAVVIVVLHVSPHHESLLTKVLSRCCPLPVNTADGEVIELGTVYVAPPDAHLLVRNGRLLLTHTGLVHHCRPSIDLLFKSVAEEQGADVLAVVLSGSGVDGAAGVRSVKAHGGTVIVEDPGTALHAGMPRAAVETGCVDRVLPVAEIGHAIADAVAAVNPW